MKPLASIEKVVEQRLKQAGCQKKRELYARRYETHSILFAFLLKSSLVGDLAIFSLDTGINLINYIPFRRYIDFKANPTLLGGPFHYRMGSMKEPGVSKVDYWYRMGSEKDLARNQLVSGNEESQTFTGTPEVVQQKLLNDVETYLLPVAAIADELEMLHLLAFGFKNDTAALNLVFALCQRGSLEEARKAWQQYARRKMQERENFAADNAPQQILDQLERSFAEEEKEVLLRLE